MSFQRPFWNLRSVERVVGAVGAASFVGRIARIIQDPRSPSFANLEIIITSP